MADGGTHRIKKRIDEYLETTIYIREYERSIF